MKFYGDYHTHSVYSDGRAKISDAALYAGKIGLKELAITDHGFANVTLSLTEKKFEKEIIDVKKVRENLENVNLLLGVEADIVDTKGNLDVTDKHLMNMDILVAGFHRFIRSTSVKDYFFIRPFQRVYHRRFRHDRKEKSGGDRRVYRGNRKQPRRYFVARRQSRDRRRKGSVQNRGKVRHSYRNQYETSAACRKAVARNA